MTLGDTEDHEKFLDVKILYTKTNMQRCFAITSKLDEEIHYTQFFKTIQRTASNAMQMAHIYF